MQETNIQYVTHLENLIEIEERFINELDQFDKSQPQESRISIVNQKKMDKIYHQSLEILILLKSISRETRQKLKSQQKPLKSPIKQKPSTLLNAKENLVQ